MKKTILLALCVIGMMANAQDKAATWAYDFTSVSPSGHTLCYDVTSENPPEVELMPPTNGYHVGYAGQWDIHGRLVIPDSVEHNGRNYAVTSIKHGTFYNQKFITSVTVPKPVRYIGREAFEMSYSWLDTIYFNAVDCHVPSVEGRPEDPNLTAWGWTWAINNPNVYRVMIIGDEVVKLNNCMFSVMHRIDELILGESLQMIGDSVFHFGAEISVIKCKPQKAPSLGINSFYWGSVMHLWELENPPYRLNTEIQVYDCSSVKDYRDAWLPYTLFKSSRFHGPINYDYVLGATDPYLGIVAVDSLNCDYQCIYITAKPNTDCHFVKWMDNGSTDISRTIMLTQDTVIKAKFEYNWGVGEEEWKIAKAYPNPTTGIFHIETGFEGTSEVAVYDTEGRRVLSRTTEGNTVEIDLGNQLAGLYYYSVANGDRRLSGKVLKK